MPNYRVRFIAVFHFRNYRSIPSLITRVRFIIAQVEKHSDIFIKPKPSVDTAKDHLNKLDAAQTLTLSRKRGSVAMRNAKHTIVVKDIYAWLAYVQELADEAQNPDKAAIIIRSAGLSIRKQPARTKLPFEAKHGVSEGDVILVAQAADKRASYKWEYSLNKTVWKEHTTTIKATTVIKGLTPGTRVYFRYKAYTKEGEHGWCQVISIIVL